VYVLSRPGCPANAESCTSCNRVVVIATENKRDTSGRQGEEQEEGAKRMMFIIQKERVFI
jgi:hypothetical protein